MKKENSKTSDSKLLSQDLSQLVQSDSQFVELFDNFVSNDVNSINTLDNKTKYLAILSVLIGSQALELYRYKLEEALNSFVTAEEVKEAVYQSVAYMGYGRAYPFIIATDEVIQKCCIDLIAQQQPTADNRKRRSDGEQAQIAIFGSSMKGFAESGDVDTRHINRWLTENCFGDYYTRKGLDFGQRELVTFCLLYAQGGSEPQLMSHIKANFNIGNDKTLLIQIVSQCLPYIGYPRSLNAINCIKKATEQ